MREKVWEGKGQVGNNGSGCAAGALVIRYTNHPGIVRQLPFFFLPGMKPRKQTVHPVPHFCCFCIYWLLWVVRIEIWITCGVNLEGTRNRLRHTFVLPLVAAVLLSPSRGNMLCYGGLMKSDIQNSMQRQPSRTGRLWQRNPLKQARKEILVHRQQG